MNRKRLTESELAELLARLQRNYTYDDEHGLLRNKKTGKLVKGARQTGGNYLYQLFWFNGSCRRQLYVHHAVWALVYGCFPKATIDHIDGNPANNHIENLREVSQSENQYNALLPWKPNAETGVSGVYLDNGLCRTKIRGRLYRFRNPHEAFFHGTMCGKRYKVS